MHISRKELNKVAAEWRWKAEMLRFRQANDELTAQWTGGAKARDEAAAYLDNVEPTVEAIRSLQNKL